MIKHFGSIILFVFFAFSTGFCTEIKTIAVTDFDANNTSVSDASLISDFLRGTLVKKECFKVVDKTNMQKILEEQKFQYSGVTDQQYAVKIGKILNVQLMVIGVYSKLEEMKYITANVVDVETGEIIISEKMRFENIKDVDKTVEKLAEKLAKDVYKEKLYDITKIKRWHGVGARGGVNTRSGGGLGGEIFYNYIKDSGLGFQLNLGICKIFNKQTLASYSSKETRYFFAPLVINYYLQPDKIFSPYFGLGISYIKSNIKMQSLWNGVIQWQTNKNYYDTNFLLNTGFYFSLNRKIKFNLDFKYFLVDKPDDTLSRPHSNATVLTGGVIYMLK